MPKKQLLGLSLLVILVAPISFLVYESQETKATYLAAPVPTDPLGSFEGPGLPGTASWTGDGQRISNPSFETGTIAPWITTQTLAAAGSQASIGNPGYDSSNAVRLTLFSGNLSKDTSGQQIPSTLSLLYDLRHGQASFSSSVRLRAAALVEDLTGSSTADRVELIVTLSTSTGVSRSLHYIFAGSKPPDTATDAYLNLTSGPITGQWLTADVQIPRDAQSEFPMDFASFNAIQEVRLSVYSQTVGTHADDPHIKYVDVSNLGNWNSGESVVYDTDLDGVYDTGEQVLSGTTTPSTGTTLSDDPKIKYVDANNNGIWDNESIVYDSNNNTYYDYLIDPVIRLPTPPGGTLLMSTTQKLTRSLFDRVELYLASGRSDRVLNGGFEAGLASWVRNPSFTSSNSTVHTGLLSARGALSNGAAEMSQSIYARPVVDNSTRFKASVNIGAMSGTSSNDIVGIWLGLVDNQERPVSLYYVFKTGDVSVPSGRNDIVYRTVPGFGTLNQWLNVDTSLASEEAAFTSLGYSSPFRIELVVLEVVAIGVSSITTAFFDDLSIQVPEYSGTAQSYFYASDAVNSTFVYTAPIIPQGYFHVEMPLGQSILNVTSPEGTALLSSEFSTTAVGQLRVDVPPSTMFKHSPVGDWRVFTTSTNAVEKVYVEDIVTKMNATVIEPGSAVNLVSKSRDPFGFPISGAIVSLTLWDTNGANVASWAGATNVLGWHNVSNVVLPPAGSQPGIFRLQASVYSGFAGVRTFQVATILILISVSISPTQLSAGSSTALSGNAISPSTGDPRPGVDLTIYYKRAGDSSWTRLTEVTTDTAGKFSYQWTPPEGDYQVVVSIGDPQSSPTQSQVQELTVGPLILIVSLSISPTQVSAGLSITISGNATSQSTGNPSAGIVMTIYYRLGGDSSWTRLTEVTTDTAGKFSYQWTPPEGDYQVVASIGDPLTSSTQSQPLEVLVGPGTATDPYLILLIISVAGAGIILAVLVLRKPKKPSSP